MKILYQNYSSPQLKVRKLCICAGKTAAFNHLLLFAKEGIIIKKSLM